MLFIKNYTFKQWNIDPKNYQHQPLIDYQLDLFITRITQQLHGQVFQKMVILKFLKNY